MKSFVGVVTWKKPVVAAAAFMHQEQVSLLGFNHHDEPLDESNLFFEYILAGKLKSFRWPLMFQDILDRSFDRYLHSI